MKIEFSKDSIAKDSINALNIKDRMSTLKIPLRSWQNLFLYLKKCSKFKIN